jgi:hypothetical protein
MTTTEYKENLVKQYNETVVNLQRLEGAIAACNELLQAQEETTTDEETTDE